MYNEKYYIYKKLVEGKPFVVRKHTFEKDGKEITIFQNKEFKEVNDFDLSKVKYTIDVETLRCGQQRRYGDSYYDYNIKAYDEKGNAISDKELMEQIIIACIDRAYNERKTGEVWYLGKGNLTFQNTHWFYSFVEPYLD